MSAQQSPYGGRIATELRVRALPIGSEKRAGRFAGK
jgi:hypothetical protein